MAGIYSSLFVHAKVTTSGDELLYTVPDGMVAIVRDVNLEAGLAASGYVTVYARNGSVVDAALLTVGNATSLGFYHWVGHQVLNAGDAIRFYCDSPPFTMRVSGYLLAVV
jgi:hypothetical protein